MIWRQLHLDDGLKDQHRLADRFPFLAHDLGDWGQRIRLACGFGRFGRFERHLATLLGPVATDACVTLYGSGDFHHVTLALLRRIDRPFNLLVLDNHPDWMRFVPFLHCGTWLHHAARHPAVQRVFHAGGDVDFDNGFRWLAPRDRLRARKIVVFPAIRTFQGSLWQRLPHEPLRRCPFSPVTDERMSELLAPFAADLKEHPLYISVDKDVMRAEDAVVNWDSGHLTLAEVETVLRGFVNAAHGELAGADILGDWSPVRVRGLLGRLMHWTEHPRLDVDADEAAQRNEIANLAVLAALSTSS